MALLLTAALIGLAAMIAYPWLGVAAGLVLAMFIGTAAIHGRRSRRALPAAVPARISLDRRVALRAAWRDLNDIERGVGVPPSSQGR